MAAITYGRDDLATKFIEEGAKMGRRLGLFSFGPDFAPPAGAWLNDSINHAARTAASYTAWGVFNWTVCVICHDRFRKSGMKLTEQNIASMAFTITRHGSIPHRRSLNLQI